MLSSPVHRHKSPAEVSQSIKNALQWFRQRPLVAVVSFILFLLLASVFVPFLILDYFSGTGGGPGPGGIGAAGMAGAGGVGAGLISSRGLNTMHLKDLRTALGIESRTDPLVELAAHGKEYAAKRGGDPAQAAGAEGGSPVLSFLSELATSSSDGQPQRAAAVVAAFKHAYGAYDRHCFGQDEYHPMSKKCSNWIGSGLTIIDAMSTMMIMGLKDEVQKARSWIESSLTFSKDVGQISFFETTIRVLGGLISAYDLSGGDKVYLDKAKDLGDRLIKAFNTPTGYPHSQINLATGSTGDFGWTGGAVLLAEIGTCQMEFFALSHRTGDDQYRATTQKVLDKLDSLHPPDGLYPIYLSWQGGGFTNQKISLGAMGDSWYEYLLKLWVVTGRKNEQLRRMYRESMTGVLSRLYTSSGPAYGDYYFLADLNNGQKERKMDHLVCFVPGMLALGVEEGIVTGEEATRHMDAARQLMRTCYASYEKQPSGLGPEFFHFNPDLQVGEGSYKLRPEMVESLFIMWRVTREEQYREYAWSAFQAIERHCRHADGGYTALVDVRNPAQKEDKMESFFLAETLKYLYLIFSPDKKLSLTGQKQPGEYFVFNTEAHPIKSWQS